jgi:hypothetical protein
VIEQLLVGPISTFLDPPQNPEALPLTDVVIEVIDQLIHPITREQRIDPENVAMAWRQKLGCFVMSEIVHE